MPKLLTARRRASRPLAVEAADVVTTYSCTLPFSAVTVMVWLSVDFSAVRPVCAPSQSTFRGSSMETSCLPLILRRYMRISFSMQREA